MKRLSPLYFTLPAVVVLCTLNILFSAPIVVQTTTIHEESPVLRSSLASNISSSHAPNVTNTHSIAKSNDIAYPIQFSTVPPNGTIHGLYRSTRNWCKESLGETAFQELVDKSMQRLQKGPAHNRPEIQNASAICALVKDEDLYIREWVNYHLYLGFDDIYVFDDARSLKLPSTDRVHVLPLPKSLSKFYLKQRVVVNSCVEIIRKREPQYHTDFVAHLDVDEFLVLRNHDNVKDFMKDHCPPDICGSVAINWLWFGTNNQTAYSDEPVVSRFRYRQDKPANVVKTIFRPEHFYCATNPHFFLLTTDPRASHPKPPFPYDTYGRITFGGASRRWRTQALGPASIHHYTKSIEEWYYRRCVRGDPATRLAKCTGKYPDAGSVYDVSALEVYERIPLQFRDATTTTTIGSNDSSSTISEPYIVPFPVTPWNPIDSSEIKVNKIVPIHLATVED